MSGVLLQLHRLRKYKEHAARCDLVDAQAAQWASEERIQEHLARVAVSRGEVAPEDPVGVARHHAFALRMELSRRKEEAGLCKNRGEVARRRWDVRAAMVAARTVERLAELREEDRSTAERRAAQRGLDELGLMGWKRR